MTEQLILLVEDEEAFVDALTISLRKEGFRVEVARDGAEALRLFEEVEPDLVLLDLMLPRVSGIDVCREIRAQSQVPIIMATARSAEVDTVVGLEVGADDYVTKPYRMRELVARMRAVLRRSDHGSNGLTESHGLGQAIKIGDVTINPQTHEVIIRDDPVQLPLKEFELLQFLMERVGLVQPRDVLIDRVWGHDYVGDTKTLDVHVKRLRAKVETEPSTPTRIVTIRGVGYKFTSPA